jgi:hypothetical protein
MSEDLPTRWLQIDELCHSYGQRWQTSTLKGAKDPCSDLAYRRGLEL